LVRGINGRGFEAGGVASPGSRRKAAINNDVICSQCGSSAAAPEQHTTAWLKSSGEARTLKAWLKAVQRQSNSQGLSSLLGGRGCCSTTWSARAHTVRRLLRCPSTAW